MTRYAGIILAAGESRRMGQPKALLPWGGSTFVFTVTSRLLDAGLDPVVVVTGAHADVIRASTIPDGAAWIENHEWRSGQAGSLRAGVRALPSNVTAAVVALVDQPQIRTASVTRLLDAHAARGAPVVRPVFNGRGGHPYLIDSCVFPRILTAPADATTFAILKNFRESFDDVAFEDNSILIDFDTPGDLAREAPRFGEQF
ncbi:MAG TPA: nucleotidyltransferase family protein [Candidatus Eisenbacteria bacterium]